MGAGDQTRAEDGALPSNATTRVEWTTEASDTGDLARRYDAWAEAYDHDLLDGEGYGMVIFHVVDVLQRFVPRQARVLELGCGTGLVGRALAAEGYTHLEGFDLSSGMLEKARKTGAYRSLRIADLNAGLPEDDASCHAVIAVGTLTYLEPAVLNEIRRVLVPGGHLVFTFQPAVHLDRGFQEIEDRLVAEGCLERQFTSEPFQPLPKSMPQVRFRLSVLRRTEQD